MPTGTAVLYKTCHEAGCVTLFHVKSSKSIRFEL